MQNFACVSHRRTRLGFFLGVIMLVTWVVPCESALDTNANMLLGECGQFLCFLPHAHVSSGWPFIHICRYKSNPNPNPNLRYLAVRRVSQAVRQASMMGQRRGVNKGANVCWCLISSKAQACGYAYVFRHMQNHCWLLCCIVCLLGIAIPGSPFVCNALKIWEVRNFPLDFLGQVRNIPLRKKPRTAFPPPPPVVYFDRK